MSGGIEVRGLTVERAGRAVLCDLSFDAARGEVLALVGASGAGKSTLLRCLNRLAEPRAGTIVLDGTDIRALHPPALRRRVALVAQTPAMLPGSVEDNLAYGLDALAAEARDAALAAAGLDAAFAPRSARKLSGGERARVALARALTRDPDALLLDEPTAALDPDTAHLIAGTITALAARELIVIVATHDLALAEQVADATLRLAPAAPGGEATAAAAARAATSRAPGASRPAPSGGKRRAPGASRTALTDGEARAPGASRPAASDEAGA